MPPPFSDTVTFCVTGRTGLGHLRRAATVARAISLAAPSMRIELVANAPVDGVSAEDLRPFTSITRTGRDEMAAALAAGAGVVVVDTAVLPGLEAIARPLCLILRETPAELCARFALAGGRRWDLVLLPNPPAAWAPPASLGLGRRTEAVGWIFRAPAPKAAPRRATPVVLVASGGGGNADTARAFRAGVDALLGATRLAAPPFHVVQNLGPRAPASARLATADATLHAGGDLNRRFAEADLVISTAGYNSVLELALTDTPALLFGIDRAYDDQWDRIARWAPLLGHPFSPADPDGAAAWASGVIATRMRRPPVDLGPSGAEAAARAILELANGR